MSLNNSPFAARLNTNYVPSDSEILEIRALLAEPEKELARMDAQIEKMEAALAQLKEQRELLKRPIDAHRVLLSPIRHIPHDVLVEIFLACLPSKHHALIDFTKAPMLLSRVCRHWSGVAYSTPMLWRSIHIPLPDYSRTPPNIISKLEKIVEDWLERSATCSLSLSIESSDSARNLERNPLVSRLLPFSRRLRHLEIAGDVTLFRPLLYLGSEDLPLLKGLRMYIIAHSPNFGTVFQSPSLEEIALTMFAAVDPRSLALPWSRLTELCLRCAPHWEQVNLEGGLDIGGAFDVLRKCPNLVQCELRVTKHALELVLDTSPITLLHLRTLVLSGGDAVGFVLQNWVSHLVVPNLRYLQVGDAFWESAVQSLPQDRSLSVNIWTQHFTPSSLAELFEFFPLISHLQISAPRFSTDELPHDAWLALLAPPHELCPMLTNISIVGVFTTPSDLAILTFVKTRMAMVTPLQQIRVRFNRQMELDIMSELEPFILDGLQVDISSPPRGPHFQPALGINEEYA
ncbi:hypothetical protein C8R45DRAFT_1067949 [Mycena sanguinolenta]|nr:hypothetical protein C8R45DRAFT_1067949 [Mycena sanguinolenta]